MELVIRAYRRWREDEGYSHRAISFLRMDENDGTDSITFENNTAEINRLIKLSKAVEEFIENYPLDESEDSGDSPDSMSSNFTSSS